MTRFRKAIMGRVARSISAASSCSAPPARAGSSCPIAARRRRCRTWSAARSLAMVRGGLLRAYAVTGGSRLASAPDIPTVDEAGFPGLHISVWGGMFVPKGTPRDVIAKLTSAAMSALADPAVRRQLADLGQEVPGREQQ